MVLTFLLLPGLWASTCVFTSDVQKVLLMWSSEYIPNSSPPHPSLFKTSLSHPYHREVLVPSGYTAFFYPWCSLNLITLNSDFCPSLAIHHIQITIDSYIQPACGALAGDALTYHPQVTCLLLSSQINICWSLWPSTWCFLSMKFLHFQMSMLVTTQMSLPLFPDTLTKIATIPTYTNLQVLCYISM